MLSYRQADAWADAALLPEVVAVRLPVPGGAPPLDLGAGRRHLIARGA